MKTVFLSVFSLASRDWAITIEFNILGRDRVYGDEEMKRKKCAQETHGDWNSEQHRNSVRIKDKNKSLSYFNVSMFGEPKNFLREIMGKIEASVF